jgi:DNA-binding CsgD family transcriptional regulator
MEALKSARNQSFSSQSLMQHCHPDQPLIQDLKQLQQAVQHLGLIVFDTFGEIRWITPQAVIWLTLYFAKPASDQYLPDDLWAWVTHQTPYLAPLCIERGDRCLTAQLMLSPSLDRYSLLLEEQASTCKLLERLESLPKLGLSQRETEVLGWIIHGCNNKIIATKMLINVSTVRKHLERIYAKLGVKSRNAAVSHVLCQLGVL